MGRRNGRREEGGGGGGDRGISGRENISIPLSQEIRDRDRKTNKKQKQIVMATDIFHSDRSIDDSARRQGKGKVEATTRAKAEE
jgi:hypothetical protein